MKKKELIKKEAEVAVPTVADAAKEVAAEVAKVVQVATKVHEEKASKKKAKEEKVDVALVPVDEAAPAPVAKFTKQESLATLDRIRELRNRLDSDYFELAGLLWEVYDKEMFSDWGYQDFKGFVNEELGFGARKAQYLVGIHDYFVNELGDPEVLAKVKPLGWTKAKELKEVITSENADEWVEKAKSMNVATLAEAAKRALAAKSGNTFDDEGGEGGSKKSDADIEVAKTLSFKLFDEQYANVMAALDRAGEVAKSDKKGHLLDTICTDYLSTNAFTASKDSMAEFFKKFEEQLNVKIFAVDADKGECVFGEGDGMRIVVVNLEKEELICGEDVLNHLVEEDAEETEPAK